jgi:dihydrolipoamide dehydrogenase
MPDLIVIGGGPAGVIAALRARELGANVTLLERGLLGGTCTNDGCVPTRVLARAARLARDAAQYANYGLSGEPPRVDFAEVLSRTQQTVYRIHEKKQLLGHLTRAGATVFENAGQAQFVDEHTVALPDGAELRADRFILCAGGRARRLAFPGSEHALTYSDLWSLKSLPRSIAIIGGAATGCQVASILAAFGAQVSLLDVTPRLLPTEDDAVSQAIRQEFERRGVQIITGIGGVEGIERTKRLLRLHYAQDGNSRALEAEVVMMAVGWPANSDTLNLTAANVKSERGYVVVDDYLRTSTPHIFAAGDITGRMMLVQSAGYEARIAAENAVLGPGQRYAHPIVPHGGFTDPEYGSVGLTEAAARAAQECAVTVVPYADLDRAVIDNHPEGFCKLIVSLETHRVVGAHIVGEQALEIVQLLAVGMAAGIWIEQLAEMELPYPTYTAIVGLAARRLAHALGVMPLAPEWRALSKSYAAEWERSDAA